MSGEHLEEDMLQRYALEPAACPPEAVAHLAECPKCRFEATEYLLLGKALRDLPVPEFRFDLAAAVMGEVGPHADAAVMGEVGSHADGAVRVRESRLMSRLVLPVVIAIVVAFPAWLFRRAAYFLFRDISGAVAWIILASAAIVVLFNAYRYYRKYQQVIQLINK